MALKILIDENLSPTLVEKLAAKGVLAQHVAHLGRDGMSDPELWRYAFEHDMVVVTVNVADFITLDSGSDLHAGIIAVRRESLTRAESWAWLEPVVDHVLEGGIDLVNKIGRSTGRAPSRPRPAAVVGALRARGCMGVLCACRRTGRGRRH